MTNQTFSRTDWKRGAIYRFGFKRNLSRAALINLLAARGELSRAAAAQLAGHWLTTIPYRTARA